MNTILAVTCASITGLTLGVVLNHKHNLSNIVAQPAVTSEIASAAPLQQLAQPESTVPSAALVADTSALEQQLNTLIQQQELLSNQQAEFNRELNAIQFRLDTHSQSFRPLRAENNSSIITPNHSDSVNSPLLPPLFQ